MRTQLTQHAVASLLVAAILAGCAASARDEAQDTGQPTASEDVGEAREPSTGTGSGRGGALGGGGYNVTNCTLVWSGTSTTTKQCYTDWILRNPYPLSTCPGQDQSGLLCYPFCAPGFTGDGPVCWQNCPPGYTDLGASCSRAGDIIPSNNSACPWWDACGVTFAKGCSTCPAGYANDGCTCRIDPDFFFKSSYGRGVGNPMSCAPGQEQIGALCYGGCPSGYAPSGLVCNATKQTCMDVPVSNAPPLSDFCFAMKSSSTVEPCYALSLKADSQEHATSLAQCQCTNCTVTSVSCDAFNNGTACH